MMALRLDVLYLLHWFIFIFLLVLCFHHAMCTPLLKIVWNSGILYLLPIFRVLRKNAIDNIELEADQRAMQYGTYFPEAWPLLTEILDASTYQFLTQKQLPWICSTGITYMSEIIIRKTMIANINTCSKFPNHYYQHQYWLWMTLYTFIRDISAKKPISDLWVTIIFTVRMTYLNQFMTDSTNVNDHKTTQTDLLLWIQKLSECMAWYICWHL